MSIVSEINRIKTNIANAYDKAEEKGATMPVTLDSSNLANTIASISSGSEEWQPHEDWWDIDSILEEDTENYQGKMIVLLRDIDETTTINRLAADKIVTSDGVEYGTTATSYNHTLDTSKDKACSLGYKTRYVIYYYLNSSVSMPGWTQIPQSSLYVIVKNITITHNFAVIQQLSLLECIKGINFIIDNNSFIFFHRLYSLKKINGITIKSGTFSGSGTGCFQDCNSLDFKNLGINVEKLNNNPSFRNAFSNCTLMTEFSFVKLGIDVTKIYEYNNIFGGANSLKRIDKLDFTSVNNTNGTMASLGNMPALVEIGTIGTIPYSGLNFNSSPILNHTTLLKILNALYDYSEDSGTHTITLGSKNLAKLTEEEIEIGTDKGWTIS